MSSLVDYVKFAWTASLVALAAACFVTSLALRLRSAGIRPLRAVLRICECGMFRGAFLLFLVAGIVQYAGSKGSGSAPLRSAPCPASGDWGTVVSDDPEMPDFTNAISELTITGFRDTGTSSLVRVGWPCGLTPCLAGGSLGLFACDDLATTDWHLAANVGIPSGAESLTVEILRDALPGDGSRAFFAAVAEPLPGLVRPFSPVATNSVTVAAWSWTLGEPTYGYGPLPTDAPLRAPVANGASNAINDPYPIPTSFGPFPQIAHGGVNAGWNNFFYLITSGTLTLASPGEYQFFVAADDDATLAVGNLLELGVTWEADAGRTNSAVVRLEADVPYGISVRYANSGAGEYELATGIEPVAPPPSLVLSTNEVVFCPGPGIDLASLAAIASVTGALDLRKAYRIDIGLERGLAGGDATEPGKLASRAKAWPDAGHSWQDGEVAVAQFALVADGEEIDAKTCVFRCEKVEPDDDCDCGCGMTSEFANGCVQFAQPFGLSPSHPWLPRGRAEVRALTPNVALGTTAALRFDHPAMRRLVSLCGLDAEVEDGLGRVTRYRNGRPAGASAGSGGQLFRNADGEAVEELANGLRIVYAEDGTASALAGPFGECVSIGDLGLSVTRGADGAVASVASVADGRLDAVRDSANAWRLVWSAPSGAHVKTFSFTLAGNAFTAVETRDAAHSFTNRWTYDAACGDWALVRGADAASCVREAKALAYDPTNRTWTVTRTVADATGAPLSRVEETVSRDGHVPRVTCRRDLVADRILATAALDAKGEVASETDALGATTAYERDSAGRVTRETVTAANVPARTVETDFADNGRVPYARRPVARRTYVDGQMLLEETFAYGVYAERHTRAAGGVTRTSRIEYDGCGREALRVEETGRATRIAFSDVASDGSWTETEDTGVVPDWTAVGPSSSVDDSVALLFALVPGRSTREVRTRNAQGDAVRIERFALVADDNAPDGASWRALDWEMHAYGASHKVVASNYSDGTTDAADWICTGPVFTRSREGVVVSNSYNAAKALAVSTRRGAFGAVTTTYGYDAAGRTVSEVTLAASCETQTVTRAYDSRDRVIRETDAQGRVTVTAYDDDARVTTTTYADGGTRIETRNADGSLASVEGTAVTPEYRFYGVADVDGIVCRTEEVRYGRPDSPRFTRTYTDGFGDVVREERGGADGTTLVTENGYDGCGNLVETVATGEPSVSYAYDEWGEAVAMASEADGIVRTVSNLTANVIRDGEVWREIVTTRGCSDAAIAPLVTSRRTRLSDLSLATNAVSVSVDMRGNETVSVTALDPETQSSFSTTVLPGLNNAAVNWYNDGMVVSNISQSAVVTETRYDAFRRETARIDGRGNVSRTRYDALGRVAATVDALTNATAYAYDAMGRVAAVTNALGETIVYAYDTRGNRISERGATYPVDYEYDIYGNKIAMTTYRDESLATGDVTHWLYDESSGALTNKVYADGQGPRYEYDANGRLTKRTWARGVETFYAYDGWGNLTNTTYSDDTPTIALRYDAMGRQVEAHDAAGVTTFAYDDYGANTNETVIGVAGTNVIERFYATFGRNAGYALNGIRQTTLGYDPATGRLVSMSVSTGEEESNHSTPTPPTYTNFTWTYHLGSDLKSSLTYPNGLTVSWTYDANSQLLQVRNATPSATISQYEYTYDAAGRRIACAHTGAAFEQADTINYAYNEKSELTNAIAVADATYTYAYDFDEIGNRRTSSECGVRSAEYAANELNQYTAISTDTSALFVSPRETFTPLFDADGNQTLVKTATGIWSVTYNGENRPILWTCGDTNITMSYDRMGRRVTKNDQRFVYDGYLQIANHHSTPTPTPSPYTYFIWDPTEPIATRPLVWFNSAPDTPHSALYYTHDGNKNVSEVIAQDGAIAAHYEYAPFGAVTAQSGDVAGANPWRFSSEYADGEIGCDYYIYRIYDFLYGRWLARDPLTANDAIRKELDESWVDSPNEMVYCINGPISFLDFQGGVVWAIQIGYSGAQVVVTTVLNVLSEIGIGAAIGVGVGKLITTATETEECSRRECAPCVPAVGTIMYRLDEPIPGQEWQFRGHWPYLNQAHYHYFRVNQNRVTCTCHANPAKDISNKGVSDVLLPGAIEYIEPTGGGFMP